MHGFLDEIYHYHTIVVLSDVVEVAFKNMASQLIASLDIDPIVETLVLLLPEQRYAATNLHETEHQRLRHNDQLALHEVGHIGIVVDAAPDKSGSSHGVPPA